MHAPVFPISGAAATGFPTACAVRKKTGNLPGHPPKAALRQQLGGHQLEQQAILQWTERRRHWDGEGYVNWQKLNRVDQREVIDYGWVLRVRPHRVVALESQLHGLHRGGQLFDAGVPIVVGNRPTK